MDTLDLREKGGVRDGVQQTSEQRLFMQFLAFGEAADSSDLADALVASDLEGVLYEDANDPRGVGLLTWSMDPDFFVTRLRKFLHEGPFHQLEFKPEYTIARAAWWRTGSGRGMCGIRCAARASSMRCRRRSR